MPPIKKPKPPSLANWLASKFINESLIEEFFGDLLEIYQERISTKGKFYAKLMYWVDVLHLLIGFTSLHLFNHQNNPTIMFKHYLIVATRNITRNKGYSVINVLGLAVGMGVCLLILQFIYFESSYDHFHPDAQNTYRITQRPVRNGETIRLDIFHTYAFGEKVKETIPEVRNTVRIHPVPQDGIVVITNPIDSRRFFENGVWYVDSTFFQMFDFPLLYGSKESALSEKHNIIITEQIAIKYFGDSDPLGKSLKISGGSLSGDFTIEGVLKKLPENSHLQFDFLLPMSFLLTHYGAYVRSDGWGWQNFLTYITLHKPADTEGVTNKLDKIIDTYLGEKLAESNTVIKTGLQPLVDIHLLYDYEGGDRNNHNIWFFSVIAIFILLIAWINYINLSTAQAIHRAKEVGIRKSIGAYRKQLISQFLFESFLINGIAVIISIGFVFVLLPFVNNIIGKELEFTVLHNARFWVGLTTVFFFGSICSGIYPAFVLSSFKPSSVLKSVNLNPRRGFSLRKGLVAFQFLTSLFLISGTYLVYKQIIFMKNQDLGIDMEQILIVPGPRVILDGDREVLESKYQVFKSSLAQHHSIVAVTGTSNVPGKGAIWTGDMRKLGDPIDRDVLGDAVLVDVNFTDTYDFNFIAGGPFNEEMESFSAVIINEVAVKTFGLGSPLEALNESIILSGLDTMKVHGVVKNVHWSSLRDAHMPTIFGLEHSFNAHFSIKMNTSALPETLAHVESAYHEAFPDDPFNYYFLDDEFNRQYQADVEFGNMFSAFTALAIFIACIGLFALVSFSATLRIKEIGIRKVLGANIRNLMLLLSREYLFLLLIANLLAIPLIIFGARSWLENYAFRINLAPDLFIIPALVLALISFMTVSYRTYFSAKANPVDSLRKE